MPYQVANRDVLLAPTGNSGCVRIDAIWKARKKPIKASLLNTDNRPMQLGSRFALLAFEVRGDEDVIFKRVNGDCLLLRDNLETRDLKNQAVHTVSSTHDDDVAQTIDSDIAGTETNSSGMDRLLQKFPYLMDKKLPGVKHYQVESIGLKDGVDWSSIPCKPLAPCVEEQIRPQIQEFFDIGAVEEVPRPPEVLTPLIPINQKGGKVRVVMDFRCLNSLCIPVQGIPIDRMRLLGSLPRRSVWSVVDFRKGFLQIPLAPSIRTFFGFMYRARFFRYKRAPFGWVGSMCHFQRALAVTLARVNKRLGDSELLYYYVDDLLVGSDGLIEHLNTLSILFEELSKDGWRINGEKSRWCVSSVEYLGAELCPEGIRPSNGLIRRLTELQKPKCAQDLRSLEGLLVQLNRYVWRQDRINELLDPWKKARPEEFRSAKFEDVWKELLSRAQTGIRTLGYWNGVGQLKMVVDASASGYGAALMDQEGNIVAMMSRKNQRPWSHSSEAELDAMLQALKTFRHLTLGRQVLVFTDSWSTAKMWDWKGRSPMMMRRMEEILREYPLVQFCAGKENELADLLSRSEYLMTETHELDASADKMCDNESWEALVKRSDTNRESGERTTFPVIFDTEASTDVAVSEDESETEDFYLSPAHDDEVVSDSLTEERKEWIRNLHEKGHYADTAMHHMLSRMDWDSPAARKYCVHVAKTCHACQIWQRRRFREDLGFIPSDHVSQVVAIDVIGPISRNPKATLKYIIVAVDYFSRWMETKIVRSPTHAQVISLLRAWIQEHGPIEQIVADSGSQFTARAFTSWALRMGIQLRWSAAYHHSSNGLVERAIQTLQGRIRRLRSSTGRPWHQLVHRAAYAMNEMVNRVTQFSPQEIRHGRSISGPLTFTEWQNVKAKAKQNTDAERKNWYLRREKKRRNESPLQIGEEVLLYDEVRRTTQVKMRPLWSGPYIILGAPYRRHFQIRIRGRVTIVHGDDLVRYRTE